MKLWNNIKIKHYKRCVKMDRDIRLKIDTYLRTAEDKESFFYVVAESYKDDLWLEILSYNKKIKELEEKK